MKITGMVFYDFDDTIAVTDVFRATHGAMDVTGYDDQFFVDAFGDNKRIAQLEWHFDRLKVRGVKISIISFGWNAVIRESLERVGLGDFFGEDLIFGNDSKLMLEREGIKGEVIREQIRLHQYSFDRVVFVDDNKENVGFCEKEKICQTLHVNHEGGMNEKDLKTIERIFH